MVTIMRDLKDLAADYIANAELLENRVKELKVELVDPYGIYNSMTTVQRLRRRIAILSDMAGESRQIAFKLEHYYDKPKKEVANEPKQEGDCEIKKQRFRKSGYGNPAPAAVEHGRNADEPPVSGICAVFSGRDTTKSDRK